MHSEIKKLAEAALKLQNKNFMDETFKRIIAVCDEEARIHAFANAEFSLAPNAAGADINGQSTQEVVDAMLGEIPPGPQVVLNPAEVAYSVDASGKPELPPVLPDSKKKAKTGGAK